MNRCRYCFAEIPDSDGRTRTVWVDGKGYVREPVPLLFCNDSHRRAAARSWDRPNDPEVVESALVGLVVEEPDGEQGSLL